MKLFTIGFTQTTAERFFFSLEPCRGREAYRRSSQAGWPISRLCKSSRPAVFSGTACFNRICRRAVVSTLVGSPADVSKKEMSWDEYAAEYLRLIQARGVESTLQEAGLDKSCLLCSEPKPDRCHRRLAAEYLRGCSDGALEVIHL